MGGRSGWVGEIKIKDHLSPAEAEIGAELGKKSARENVENMRRSNQIFSISCWKR